MISSTEYHTTEAEGQLYVHTDVRQQQRQNFGEFLQYNLAVR